MEMAERPTLTVFSNYFVGGVYNFHRNILSQDITNAFDKKVIFLHWKDHGIIHMDVQKGFGLCPEFVCEVGSEMRAYAKEISDLIGNERGIVVTNFEPELVALHFYPKPEKTVIFLCHDEYYVRNALKYEFIIDAFVTHNPYFFDLLLEQLPQRKEDIYYLPYGVEITELHKTTNMEGPLNLVWLARLVVSKGIYEIPEIDDLLKEKQIPVNWTIIGYGPESENFKMKMKDRKNFSYAAPSGNKELMNLLEQQDVFVLPSRLDGLPVAMLEVMSKGVVPVMYKFNKGIPKVITKDVGFIVEVGDNTSIADCIGQLHYDRTLLRHMSEKARAKVVDEYDIKKQSEKYYHLYKTIQPSTRKGKWKRLSAVHGKAFHPLIPGSVVRIYRRLKNLFFKEGKGLSIDPLK